MENQNTPKKTIEENGMIFNGKGFIETPLDFLERLLLNHEICRDGFKALIEFRDEFISLGADLQQEVFTDNYIENRPGVLESIEALNLDIAKLELEIEDEKANPSDVSMAVRLYNRLGHL